MTCVVCNKLPCACSIDRRSRPLSWQEACEQICEDISCVLIAKQRDYGSSNITEFGEIGIIIRLNDKLARLKNLVKNNIDPKNEILEDTYFDIAGYAILALMFRKGNFNLPFYEEKK